MDYSLHTKCQLRGQRVAYDRNFNPHRTDVMHAMTLILLIAYSWRQGMNMWTVGRVKCSLHFWGWGLQLSLASGRSGISTASSVCTNSQHGRAVSTVRVAEVCHH